MKEEEPASSIPDGLSSNSLDTDNLLVNSATLPDQILAQPPAPVPSAISTEGGSASIRPEDLIVPKDEPMDMGANAAETSPFPSIPISSYASESGKFTNGRFTLYSFVSPMSCKVRQR